MRGSRIAALGAAAVIGAGLLAGCAYEPVPYGYGYAAPGYTYPPGYAYDPYYAYGYDPYSYGYGYGYGYGPAVYGFYDGNHHWHHWDRGHGPAVRGTRGATSHSAIRGGTGSGRDRDHHP